MIFILIKEIDRNNMKIEYWKFRTNWAWGSTQWKHVAYKENFIKECFGDDEEDIAEHFANLENAYTRSDKFRGVDWEKVNANDVPNKFFEDQINDLKSSIEFKKIMLNEIQEDFKQNKGLYEKHKI